MGDVKSRLYFSVRGRWNPTPRLLPSRARVEARRGGFSVIEALVVLVLIVLILVLLAPLIEALHSRSLVADCSNNLRMIGSAMDLYQMRNNGWLPANQKNGSWRTYLDPDLRAPFVPDAWKGTSPLWECPVGGEYFANNLIIGDNRYDPRLYRTHWKISQFPRPTRVPVVTDAQEGPFSKAAIGDFRGIDFRHNGGAAFLFLDWRVQWMEGPAESTELWWNEPLRGKHLPKEEEEADAEE